MMTTFQRGFLNIIHSGVTGIKASVSDNFAWENACSLAKTHQVSALFYNGVYLSGLSVPDAVLSHLKQDTQRAMVVSARQEMALAAIFSAFEAHGIDHLPLKGTVLKAMYPKPELRAMVDADILIRQEQYAPIRDIMLSLGFCELQESDHELIWDKPGVLHLELHKHLIPSYNTDFYPYFGTGWQLAHRNGNSHRYQLSQEDHFAFLFTHYAKHYRDGGIGLRQPIDLFLFLQKHPSMDTAKLESIMDSLHLLAFYRNTMDLLSVWFQGGSGSEITDFLTDSILDSGAFGTADSHSRSQGLREARKSSTKNVKQHYILHSVFLPLPDMALKYPVLKKHPVLLPCMWLRRGIDVLFHRKNRIAAFQKTLSHMSNEEIAQRQAELHYVGLDFHF